MIRKERCLLPVTRSLARGLYLRHRGLYSHTAEVWVYSVIVEPLTPQCELSPSNRPCSVGVSKPRNEAPEEEVKNDIHRRVSVPFVDWQEVVGCEDDTNKGDLRPRG